MARPRLLTVTGAGRLVRSVRIALSKTPRSLGRRKWLILRSRRNHAAAVELPKTFDVAVQTGTSLANSSRRERTHGGNGRTEIHPLKLSRVTLSSPLFPKTHIVSAHRGSRTVSASLQPPIGKDEVYVSIVEPLNSSDSDTCCKPPYPTSRYQRTCSRTMPARKPLPRDFRRKVPLSPVATRRHRDLLREHQDAETKCRGSWYSEQSPLVLATFPFCMDDNRHLSLKAHPAWWYRQEDSRPSTPSTEDLGKDKDLREKRPIVRKRALGQSWSPTSWRESWARLKTPKLDPHFNLAEITKELGILKLST